MDLDCKPNSAGKKANPKVTAALNRYMMSLPAPTVSTTKRKLLTLPMEIQLHILSYLSNEPTYGSREPTLMLLRRTHPSFRKIIPVKPYRPPNPTAHERREMAIQLIGVEHSIPSLFATSYYPCYKCVRVLHAGQFVFSEAAMVMRNLDIGGARAALRQCADCSRIFRPGVPKDYFV